MKVLVVGSGGREHALSWRLSRCNSVKEVYIAPGNPGTAEVGENLQISPQNKEELLRACEKHTIDLVVVGPEQPLCDGLSDYLQERGIVVFGPTKPAAMIEGSKSFAKDIMTCAGVSTADFNKFTDLASAQRYCSSKGIPLVLKADGLAAGKGVVVCTARSEIDEALSYLFLDLKSETVIVEDFLEGVEASYIVAVGRDEIVPMATSHDYKRLMDNDRGPNTGGMGSVSPTPRISSKIEENILEKVIYPTVKELNKRGIPYVGFLYAGLMISNEGEPRVLEFNCRLGDPECQSIMVRAEFDLATMLFELATGEKLSASPRWTSEYAVCVVVASDGYPRSPIKGDVIYGIEQARDIGAYVFHAGTTKKDDRLLTNGGRVLNVVGKGKTLEEARSIAYKGVDMIQFRGAFCRRDIGL